METNNPMHSMSSPAATGSKHAKVMLITPERVLYAGLFGRPMTRELGSLTVYVSLGNPFQVQMPDGSWRSEEMWVVQPDEPHLIATVDKIIGVYMIEPEYLDMEKLPDFLREANRERAYPEMLARMREAFLSLIEGRVQVGAIRMQLDRFFLGEALPSRTLEARMAAVVNRITRNPCDTLSAEHFADQVDLSFSRFLHLFKAEVGTTFRRFRAWKRARSFLAYVNTPLNLTDIALETGYPDSSHFSHTVRRYWGLTPKDIIAGSRRLSVITDTGSYISTVH